MGAIVAKKRSIVVGGRRTSISLEDEFWVALNMAAMVRRMSISSFVTEIVRQRSPANLSSSIRIALLTHYQNMSEGIAFSDAETRESALIIPFGRSECARANRDCDNVAETERA